MTKDENTLISCEKHLGEIEEHLQAQLQRFDKLVSNVPVGVYIYWIRKNGHLEFEYVSDRWCQIHQLKREDALDDASKATGQAHHEENEAFLSSIQLSFKNRVPLVWEGRFINGAGELIWLHIEATPIVHDNGDIQFFGITEDITLRKQSEEMLQENEEQFRAMFEKHYAVMLLIDPDSGSIIRANQGAEAYYGYTAAEFQQLTIHQINQLSEAQIAAEMAKAKTQKRNFFNFIHRLASGELRHVEVHSSPIPFKGKIILFSIIYDVTERKQAEEALLDARLQAEKANEAKSRYLSHINHELRTPLNGLFGFLQLMEVTELDEQQQMFMKHMKQSSSHILSIVNNVLDMGKIEAGEMRLSKAPFNLPEEVEISLASLRSLAKLKNIQLHSKIHEQVPVDVLGDPDRLRQIILNLGGNAVKYTQAGQVSIAVNCLETTQHHHLIKLVVEDTGAGMAPETLEKLFRPYYQVDTGVTPQAKGTGLGLAITRELVELMGGRIEVESALGNGTKVEVFLKLSNISG